MRFRNRLFGAVYPLVSRFKNIGEIDSISTHLTAAEKLQIYCLARRRHRVAVEVGSYLGASACMVALALSERTPRGSLYCVDTWQNDSMSEGDRDTYAEFRRNTARFSEIIRPLRGSSVDVAHAFLGTVDFLFIDGDHSYAGVAADVEAWFPKLNQDAIVVFHDVGWAEGVQQVIQEKVRPLARREGRLPNLYWAFL